MHGDLFLSIHVFLVHYNSYIYIPIVLVFFQSENNETQWLVLYFTCLFPSFLSVYQGFSAFYFLAFMFQIRMAKKKLRLFSLFLFLVLFLSLRCDQIIVMIQNQYPNRYSILKHNIPFNFIYKYQ